MKETNSIKVQIHKQSSAAVPKKKIFKKFPKIHRKTSVLKAYVNKVPGFTVVLLKVDSGTGVFL